MDDQDVINSRINVNFYVKYASEIFEYIYENDASVTDLIGLFIDKQLINRESYDYIKRTISSFLNRVKKLTNNDLYKDDNYWKINKEVISSHELLSKFVHFVSERNGINQSMTKKRLRKHQSDQFYNFLIYGLNGKPKNPKINPITNMEKINHNIVTLDKMFDELKNSEKSSAEIKECSKESEVKNIEITVQNSVNEITIKKDNGFQIKITI